MAESFEQTQALAAGDIRREFRADLDAFEALERKLLADERRERAELLAARFSGLAFKAKD